MASTSYLPSNPAYGAGSSSQQRLTLDNLIRRELKVGDPNDPNQIAQALLDRYKGDPRAQAIAQEARGLPFLQGAALQPVAIPPASSCAAEWQQAIDDIESDLRNLTGDAILKDVAPELQGWAQAIRSAVREGYDAARLALDPRNRDKAFAIRRQLNDYARVARLVGALTVTVSQAYRKLAQSLDEAAAVLLVAMGETLANVGFGGGRFLLQAPYTELQVRRDAVIYALRNLVGATQQAYGPNDWPRGLDAYRNLYRGLEAQGQGDLRSLLEETELARAMDELVQRAADGNINGLRALGATAQIDLARFRRLVSVSHHLAQPESPPLAAFLEALMLFSESFVPSGGVRLLRIARPPILLYGLYGMQVLQKADQRLLQLIQKRGVLAGHLDCYTACACGDKRELCQIVLDKVLYDIDRAIDLYALGSNELGAPECRASAYSFVVDAALLQCCDFGPEVVEGCKVVLQVDNVNCDLADPADPQALLGSIRDNLIEIRGLLRPVVGDPRLSLWDTQPQNYASQCGRKRRHQELCIQREAEMELKNLIDTMAPGCIRDASVFGEPSGVMPRLMRRALNLSEFDLFIDAGIGVLTVKTGDPNQNLISVLDDFKLRHPKKPNATICDLIDRNNDCPPVTIKIPPHLETSLDSIANDVSNDGSFR